MSLSERPSLFEELLRQPVHMQPSLPWIARFSDRAMQLLPGLPVLTAIHWAVAKFPFCGHLEPASTAETFVRSKLAHQRHSSSEDLRRRFDTSRPPEG